MILDIISFSCPLILASMGALFSEYTGTLALFLEGLIGFSAFLGFGFTVSTGSLSTGILLTIITTILITGIFSLLIEKTKANKFIASLGMNLIFSASVSLFSSLFFKTRGVLTSDKFIFNTTTVEIFSITTTFILVIAAVIFLIFTQKGIYIRITGSDSDILTVKGINPSLYRTAAWCITAFFTAFSGIILSLRVSAFVPGISGGKGWMALAAVFLGKKKWWQIIIFVIIFCGIDFISAGIQNYISAIPSSVILALPYIVILLLISIKK